MFFQSFLRNSISAMGYDIWSCVVDLPFTICHHQDDFLFPSPMRAHLLIQISSVITINGICLPCSYVFSSMCLLLTDIFLLITVCAHCLHKLDIFRKIWSLLTEVLSVAAVYSLCLLWLPMSIQTCPYHAIGSFLLMTVCIVSFFRLSVSSSNPESSWLDFPLLLVV